MSQGLDMSLDDIIKKSTERPGGDRPRKQQGVSVGGVRGGVRKQQYDNKKQFSQRQELPGQQQTQRQGRTFQNQRQNVGVQQRPFKTQGARVENPQFRQQGNTATQFHNNNSGGQGQGFRGNQQDRRSNLNRYNNNNNNINNNNANNSSFNRQGPRRSAAFAFLDDDFNVVVRLKQTDIIQVTPAGEVTLNTGGWFTATTIDAMNTALNPAGIQVVSLDENPSQGNWQVSHLSTSQKFYDGIKLYAKGPLTANRAKAVLYALGQGKLVAQLNGGFAAEDDNEDDANMQYMNAQPSAHDVSLAARAAAASRAAMMSQIQAGGLQSAALRLAAANLAVRMGLPGAAAAAAAFGAAAAGKSTFGAGGDFQGAATSASSGQRGANAADQNAARRLRTQGRF